MLRPRRDSLDSSATSDCATGRIGPSDSPIRIRDSSRIANDPARPVMNEQSEKMTKVTSRIGTRLPEASASRPPSNPAMAHAAEKPDEMTPSCVLVRPRSFTRFGPR